MVFAEETEARHELFSPLNSELINKAKHPAQECVTTAEGEAVTCGEKQLLLIPSSGLIGCKCASS